MGVREITHRRAPLQQGIRLGCACSLSPCRTPGRHPAYSRDRMDSSTLVAPASAAINQSRAAQQVSAGAQGSDDTAGSPAGRQHHQPSNTSTKVDEIRLRKGMQKLTESGFSQSKVERLAGHIRTASDEELFRIRPKNLARDWDMELGDLLSILLQATRSGLLRTSWDVMCPHCHGVRRESRSLEDLREFGRCDICDICDIDFEATMLESIEVTFKLLQEIREVREVFYCSAEPAKKPHIIIQQHIEPGESTEGWEEDRTAVSIAGGEFCLTKHLSANDYCTFDRTEFRRYDATGNRKEVIECSTSVRTDSPGNRSPGSALSAS
jgi:hypothetical protein